MSGLKHEPVFAIKTGNEIMWRVSADGLNGNTDTTVSDSGFNYGLNRDTGYGIRCTPHQCLLTHDESKLDVHER